MLALLECSHFAASDAHVPHAPSRQHFDGVPIVVVLRSRLVHRAHAPGAERVHEREGAEYETLCLALKQAVGLELGQDALTDKKLGQGRRLGSGMFIEEFSDDLIELSAIDQVAASQVPDKPF